MQTYNVISMSPFINSFPTCISGTCVGGALKDLIKIYHKYKINELIIADQMNHWKANMKYYNENGRKKVKIGYDVFPGNILGIKQNGDTVGAIGLNPIKASVVNPYVPSSLSDSSLLTPIMPSIYPSVVYTPNNVFSSNLFNGL